MGFNLKNTLKGLGFADDGAGSSFIDVLTGKREAEQANERNIRWTNYWNDKSIELANTAHQREIKDLKAAGLNPILSAGGSGAATPGLSIPQTENEMPGGYLEQANKAMSLVQGGAQTSNLMTNSALQRAQANQVNLDTAIKSKMAPSTIKLAEQNVQNAIAQQALTDAQTTLTGKQRKKIEEETKKIQGGKITDFTGTNPEEIIKKTTKAIKKHANKKTAKDVMNSNAWMGYPGLF